MRSFRGGQRNAISRRRLALEYRAVVHGTERGELVADPVTRTLPLRGLPLFCERREHWKHINASTEWCRRDAAAGRMDDGVGAGPERQLAAHALEDALIR